MFDLPRIAAIADPIYYEQRFSNGPKCRPGEGVMRNFEASKQGNTKFALVNFICMFVAQTSTPETMKYTQEIREEIKAAGKTKVVDFFKNRKK